MVLHVPLHDAHLLLQALRARVMELEAAREGLVGEVERLTLEKSSVQDAYNLAYDECQVRGGGGVLGAGALHIPSSNYLGGTGNSLPSVFARVCLSLLSTCQTCWPPLCAARPGRPGVAAAAGE